jgi:siroheme synthase
VAIVHWGTTEKQEVVTGSLETIEEVAVSRTGEEPGDRAGGCVFQLLDTLKSYEEIRDLIEEEDGCQLLQN